MATSGLDLQPEWLDSVAELLATAGTLLTTGLDEQVPPCGGDAVSVTLFNNLNARLRWLVAHLRAGQGQALAASGTVIGNAQAYRAEDSVAAAAFSGAAASSAPETAPPPTSATAPGSAPETEPLPDISGTEGEELARALESGAGPGPALAMSALLSSLAAQISAAGTELTAAHSALVAAGDSALHAPLLTRLARAVTWSTGVTAHASALATSFDAAAGAFSATYGVVGPSTGWRAMKTGYQTAIARNIATGGLNQTEVDDYKATLTGWQQQSSDAAGTYQETGEAASTVPGELPDPGLDPNQTDQDNPGEENTERPTELDGEETNPLEELGGAQELLSPLLGALSSLGQANPLAQVGKIGEQLGQQVSQIGQQVGQVAQQAGKLSQHPTSPLKANPLASTHLSGAGSAGKGGLNPGAGIPGAAHPASAPPATPASPSRVGGKPGTTTSPTATTASGSGMGMMPMNRGAGGDSKSSPVPSYPGEPLAELPPSGTPGVVGDTAKSEPAVDPSVKKAVLNRIAKRKNLAAGEDG